MNRRIAACLIVVLIGLTVSGCSTQGHRTDPNLLNLKIVQLKESQDQLRAEVDALSARLDSLLADNDTRGVISQIKADIEELNQSILELEAEITGSSPPPSDTSVSEIESYYKAGEYRRAVEAYENVVAADPDTKISPDLLLTVAMAYKKAAMMEEHKRLLRTVISRHPGTEPAKAAKQLLDALPQ